MPKYPKIKVKLTDGNAFSILGKVRMAMKKGGVSKEEMDKFMSEAMGGDYNSLLKTCMEYVSIS